MLMRHIGGPCNRRAIFFSGTPAVTVVPRSQDETRFAPVLPIGKGSL